MTAPVGWYAHHHGRGHLVRATQVADHLVAPVHLLTSAPVRAGDWSGPLVRLAPDVAPDIAPDVAPDAPDVVPDQASGPAAARPTSCTVDGRLPQPLPPVLHWAPTDLPSLRTRTRQFAEFFERTAPALVVVDVSVEVALQARLAGVPVVWMRQHGRRDDLAHRSAYASASTVLAPWPAWLDDGDPIADAVPRQLHVGGFSRFQRRPVDRGQAREELGWDGAARHVVVLLGGGGHDLDPAVVRAAARATRSWHWTVLGARDHVGPEVSSPGWVADPFPYLVGADVVVAATGHNAVMDVAAAGTVLVTVPQSRPFGEQVHKATLLDRHGLAHVWWTWPPAHRVGHLLGAALDRPRSPAALVAGGGAVRAAAVLDGLVESLTAGRVPTSASGADGVGAAGGRDLGIGGDAEQFQRLAGLVPAHQSAVREGA